jgi:ELWxxDGT repeat protein
MLVKEICPGNNPLWSGPTSLTAVNDILFFTADDGTHGTELWKSDGTAGGTAMVKDIWTGSGSSNLGQLTRAHGALYFAASDGIWGRELWRSDGTDAVMVHDINPGAGHSDPGSIAEVNGSLLFGANDGVHGTELWRVPLVKLWDGGGDGASWSDPLNWSDNTLPTASDDVVISVSGAPVTNISASVTIRSLVCDETLVMAPGSGVLRTGSLQLGPTGHLDLSNNALIVDYADVSSLDTIQGYLSSGYASGAWNGLGINSTIAATTPNRALGYAQATDIGSPPSFAGQAIDDTAVLVRFTVSGDSDLDGKVDVADLGRLASNWQQTPRNWSEGDFDYSGSVDVNDLGILASNWQQGLSAPPAAASARGRLAIGLFSRAPLKQLRIRSELDELLA